MAVLFVHMNDINWRRTFLARNAEPLRSGRRVAGEKGATLADDAGRKRIYLQKYLTRLLARHDAPIQGCEMATNTKECGRYLHNKIPETSVAALGRPAGRAPFPSAQFYFGRISQIGPPRAILLLFLTRWTPNDDAVIADLRSWLITSRPFSFFCKWQPVNIRTLQPVPR